MKAVDAAAGLIEVLELEGREADSLAADLRPLPAEITSRLLRLARESDRPPETLRGAVFAAADLLRLAEPDLARALMSGLERIWPVSSEAALAYLGGAVDFLGRPADGGLIDAWAETGRRIMEMSAEGGTEFLRRAPLILKPLPSGLPAAGRVVNMMHRLPVDRAEMALSDLAALVGSAVLWSEDGRADDLLDILERIAAVSWTGALAFLPRVDEVVRHLGWEYLDRWVDHGLSRVRSAAEDREGRARLYFGLSSAAARSALDRIGPGPSLMRLNRYLTYYAAVHAGRPVGVEPFGRLDEAEARGLRLPVHTDGRTIHLPERLPFLDRPEEGEAFYRVLTAREAGRIRGGLFELDLAAVAPALAEMGFHPPPLEDMPPPQRFLAAFPRPALARNIFDLMETARVEAALAREYPGLAGDLHRFAPLLGPGGVNPDRPADAVMNLAERMLRGLDIPSGLPRRMPELARRLAGDVRALSARPDQGAEDAALLCAAWYPLLEEAYLSGLEAPLTKLGAKASGGEEEGPAEPPPPGGRESPRPSLLSRPGQGDAAETDLTGLLEKARRGKQGGEPEGGPYWTYPEWDARLNDYRLDWARVREATGGDGDESLVARVRAEYGPSVFRIRRRFEMLKPAGLVRRRGLTDGDELDIDRLLVALAARKAGRSGSDKIYRRRLRDLRDVAACVLVDLSGSTARETASGKTVIDLEKEALVLLSEALETVGDDWAFFGFTGAGREGVVFQVIKDFGRRFDGPARAALGGLKPGDQNRDGAALRHAARRLAARGRRRSLLLLVTDGRPDDYEYEGEYARADTRAALREIRRRGLHVFGVVVGEEGRADLEGVFGRTDFAVVGRIEDLPERLSHIYRKLTS